MEEQETCPRCDGDGTENIELSATILGRELSVDGLLTKTCEECNGAGELHYYRDANMRDLSDVQIKVLTEADIYRETGGQTEEDVEQMKQQQRNMPGGQGAAHAPAPGHM